MKAFQTCVLWKKKKKGKKKDVIWVYMKVTSFNFGWTHLLVTKKDQVLKILHTTSAGFILYRCVNIKQIPDSQQNINFKIMSNIYLRENVRLIILFAQIDQIIKTRWRLKSLDVALTKLDKNDFKNHFCSKKWNSSWTPLLGLYFTVLLNHSLSCKRWGRQEPR